MIFCTDACRELLDRLVPGETLTCRVYSVHSKAMNLEDEAGHIITCLWESGSLVPLGFCAPRPQNTRWQRGDTVLLGRETTGDFVFTEATRAHALGLAPGTHCETAAQRGSMLRALCARRPEGGMAWLLSESVWALPAPYGPLDAAQREAGRRVSEFVTAMTRGVPDAQWPGVLGLGIGLTPAADDFVLGLLAALRWRGHPLEKPLTDYVQRYRRTTTLISSEMLRHGAEGRYAQHILRLFSALEQGADPVHCLDDFALHGHSSGMYALFGVYRGLLLADGGAPD